MADSLRPPDGSGLPGAVLPAGWAASAAAEAPDAAFLAALAAYAGIALPPARIAALAPQLAAGIAGVRRAMPARRDQLAPALIFRVPPEV